MAVGVPAARTEDRLGLVALRTASVAAGVKRLRQLWVEGASPAEGLAAGGRGVQQPPNIAREATTHTEGQGCQVRPWRGAVERTGAWRLNDRRQSRDEERVTAHSAAMLQMRRMRLLLNRLV